MKLRKGKVSKWDKVKSQNAAKKVSSYVSTAVLQKIMFGRVRLVHISFIWHSEESLLIDGVKKTHNNFVWDRWNIPLQAIKWLYVM